MKKNCVEPTPKKDTGITVSTADSKFWVTDGGYGLSKDKCDATIFPTIHAAKSYINGTNVFGDLKICKETRDQ